MFVKGFSFPPNVSGSRQSSGRQVTRFAKREGAELLEQHCCVDGAHRMTFPADRVVEVKRASGVYDFEHETRETDKKKHAAGSPRAIEKVLSGLFNAP